MSDSQLILPGIIAVVLCARCNRPFNIEVRKGVPQGAICSGCEHIANEAIKALLHSKSGEVDGHFHSEHGFKKGD